MSWWVTCSYRVWFPLPRWWLTTLTSDTLLCGHWIYTQCTHIHKEGLILSYIKFQKKSYKFSKFAKKGALCPLVVTQSIDENLHTGKSPPVSLIRRECYFPLRVNKWPNLMLSHTLISKVGSKVNVLPSTLPDHPDPSNVEWPVHKVQQPVFGSLLQGTRQALGQPQFVSGALPGVCTP